MTGGHVRLHLRLAFIYAAVMLLLALFFAQAAHGEVGAPLGQHLYYRILKGEDFFDIAQKFDLGIGELRAANPAANEVKLKAGQVIVLPTAHLLPDVPHEGIVINLPEHRLYYFDDPSGPMGFPVTVGKEGWETPLGVTYIANKREHPTWTVPDKIRAESPELPAVVEPGPDNPLGDYAMDLGFDGIRIHGTNNPKSIGRQSSHGCIRMYPADIEKLFNLVPLKTKVTIINQPYKIGWLGDNLLLEVAPPAAGAVARNVTLNEVRDALNQKLTSRAMVDWETTQALIDRRDGMPASIGHKAPVTPVLAAFGFGGMPETQPAVARVTLPPAQIKVPAVMHAFTPYTAHAPRPVRPATPASYGISGAAKTAPAAPLLDYYANNGDE